MLTFGPSALVCADHGLPHSAPFLGPLEPCVGSVMVQESHLTVLPAPPVLMPQGFPAVRVDVLACAPGDSTPFA